MKKLPTPQVNDNPLQKFVDSVYALSEEAQLESRIADLEQQRAVAEASEREALALCVAREERISDLERQLAASQDMLISDNGKAQMRITILELALRDICEEWNNNFTVDVARKMNVMAMQALENKQNENQTIQAASVCAAQQLPHTD